MIVIEVQVMLADARHHYQGTAHYDAGTFSWQNGTAAKMMQIVQTMQNRFEGSFGSERIYGPLRVLAVSVEELDLQGHHEQQYTALLLSRPIDDGCRIRWWRLPGASPYASTEAPFDG